MGAPCYHHNSLISFLRKVEHHLVFFLFYFFSRTSPKLCPKFSSIIQIFGLLFSIKKYFFFLAMTCINLFLRHFSRCSLVLCFIMGMIINVVVPTGGGIQSASVQCFIQKIIKKKVFEFITELCNYKFVMISLK